MELIVFILQALQDFDCLLLGRFLDIYLLEPAHDALALSHVAVELLVGGGTNESDVASLQILLQHIGSIRSAIRATTGTYHIMNLINVDDGVAFLHGSFHHHLDALFKVATILGAGKHLSHIHTVDASSLETFGYLILVDELGKAINQGGLTYARFTDMERIVLLGTTEHLDGSIQFLLSADKRIMLLHLIRDAGNQLVPILRLSASAFLFIIIIIVIIVILIVAITHHQGFITWFIFERIIAIHARQELALTVAHILAQQECSFRVLQAKHCLYEMRHVHEFSVSGSSQGASRTKHRLEERRRLRQIFDIFRHTLLLGEPSHQVLMHLDAIHTFLLQSLAEGILAEQ